MACADPLMPVIARISFAGSPRVPFAVGNFMPQSARAFSSTVKLGVSFAFPSPPGSLLPLVTMRLILIGWAMTASHTPSCLPGPNSSDLLRSQVGPSLPTCADVSAGDLAETMMCRQNYFFLSSSLPPHLGDLGLNLNSSPHPGTAPVIVSRRQPPLRPRHLRYPIIHFVTTLFMSSTLLVRHP